MKTLTYTYSYLERLYVASHDALTEGGRALLREEIRKNPQTFATDTRSQALLAYAHVQKRLTKELSRLDDMPDEEFEMKRDRLFDSIREDLARIQIEDPLCLDAQLLSIILADVPLDSCLSDLLLLEQRARTELTALSGFDVQAPGYWDLALASQTPGGAAALTQQEPLAIGWLHTLETLAQLSLASARYRAAMNFAQQVISAQGYPNRSEGTVFLALARLEDEDGFFRAAHNAVQGSPEDSPWYLLGRTLLLYKLGRERSARRALCDFAARCDGGAFYLLNPTYLTPYLPDRPYDVSPWELSHQAVWEADGIIVDTPDFTAWAAEVDGIEDASEHFAARFGL